MASLTFSSSLVALGFLAAAAVSNAGTARDSAPVDESSTDSVVGPVVDVLRLEDLYAAPRAHLGNIARVRFQLRGLREEWEPYITRFGPQDYMAFDVWSDDQLLWEKAEFDEPLATLFLRRDCEAARTLRGAPKYARFEALLRVEQLFLGRPWIELFELRPLPEALNEGALLHATRGVRSLAERKWGRAEDDLRRALASNLPAPARADLEWRLEVLAHFRDLEAEADGSEGRAAGRNGSTR